jgi:NitT/TauT family transport system permease protein
MRLRRLLQFLLVYVLGVGGLLAVKAALALSDYVIPSAREVLATARSVLPGYLGDTLNTLSVAVVGHLISIALAALVGIVGRLGNWFSQLIRTAAYAVQSYPIVAVAPIIFILAGDGLLARLLIAAMICYFPLLLAFIGVLAEPVTDIEHFYRATGRLRWQLEVKIRAFQNIHKLITIVAGSATMAMVGTIVAEFIGANAGIGYRVRIALYQSDLAKILVALLLIGIATCLYLTLLEGVGAALRRKWDISEGGAA